MTLLQPHPATAAIQVAAKAIAAGIQAARTDESRRFQEEVQRRLKAEYEAAPADEFVVPVHDDRTPGVIRDDPVGRCRRFCRIPYDLPDHEVPRSWHVKFYERVCWPSVSPIDTQPVFRYFLQVARGRQRPVEIPVHDMRDSWSGPSFKAQRLQRFLPTTPHFPIRTWIVFGDKLSARSLEQWLTVVLAQRTLLTPEEESAAVGAFFSSNSDLWTEKRQAAYLDAKRRFVHPIGGYPSFPRYLRVTANRRMAAEEWTTDDSDAPLGLVSMRCLRQCEPNLHRALLDRIAKGRISVETYGGKDYVTETDAELIDVERIRNAEVRRTQRFPREMRRKWEDRLTAQGRNRRSAKRNIQRWVNTDKLSEAEIEERIEGGVPRE